MNIRNAFALAVLGFCVCLPTGTAASRNQPLEPPVVTESSRSLTPRKIKLRIDKPPVVYPAEETRLQREERLRRWKKQDEEIKKNREEFEKRTAERKARIQQKQQQMAETRKQYKAAMDANASDPDDQILAMQEQIAELRQVIEGLETKIANLEKNDNLKNLSLDTNIAEK